MSETPRVHVGQTIRFKRDGRDFFVLQIVGSNVLVTTGGIDPRPTYCLSLDDIVPPEPPKAEPGVVYQNKTSATVWFGLHDGRLGTTAYTPTFCDTATFDPAEFSKVRV